MGRNNGELNIGASSGKKISFETHNPKGENSVYTQLPDGRWERNKRATGEKFIMDRTLFIHPDFDNPHFGGSTGGPHGFRDGNWLSGTEEPIPNTHISKTPKIGYTPLEFDYTTDKDSGRPKMTRQHRGHKIVSISNS